MEVNSSNVLFILVCVCVSVCSFVVVLSLSLHEILPYFSSENTRVCTNAAH